MANFVFRSTSFPFVISREDGTEIKSYKIDVGSEKFFREIMDKGNAVVKNLENFEGTNLDEAKANIKQYVDFTLGDGAFDYLYIAFEQNIFCMIELTKCITEEIRNKWDERLKAYA
ncbi:MAG TPA: hypothetical protein PLA54_08380 [Spirochaetota bacterium]|nr:hypothetical protein [Spirochaetota bacterium]